MMDVFGDGVIQIAGSFGVGKGEGTWTADPKNRIVTIRNRRTKKETEIPFDTISSCVYIHPEKMNGKGRIELRADTEYALLYEFSFQAMPAENFCCAVTGKKQD